MRRRKQGTEHAELDPGLADLARAFRGEDPNVHAARGPTPDLCETALQLASELYVYERRGGIAHIDDVVEQPAYRDLFSGSESDTSWPRPTGRWEILLRRGEDTERVIGEAGGDWVVEGLMNLGSLTNREGRVLVDIAGSEEGLAQPPKQASPESKRLARGSEVAGGTFVVTGGPASTAYLLAAVAHTAGQVMGDRPPRWHADPSSRHELRFWGGTAWTRFVFDSRDPRRS